ncbi:MAG TPA: substrate-binding domain-containing protein [Candidatus Hydrogenedentes bacterium]|nr:substrate-binding domain-containing protein [Candidatus Hydrogenedentota bacterium]HOT50475.1 substrate-binding domain-containing protein [Candidatus Hydrogenedentota bacterium]HOV75735.1 substrate-binding domain-containing protein [Candidatus Hydrogenedentota bacterium]HPC16056.1 substrate-binding domain-containing protein [Candidatus Hydrogenedentota bacterium]HRT20010.1 substrate-binding domain-containing protein [Candidatus Hydrogenedentota bacterium]
MGRRVTLAAAALAIVLQATGCGHPNPPPDTSAPATSSGKTIGAALLTQTHVFYQDMVSALQEESRKHGFKLILQYADFDSSKQNNHIETFVIQKVDALIVAPNDSAGIAPVIADARAKGIPVFTVDIAAHGADVVSHIASDNVMGGELVGEYLAKAMGGKGKVAIIDHPAVASVQDRVAGFEKAIARYPDIRIVQKVPGEGQRDKAFRAAQDLVQANPDLDGIFAINDDSALGALAAVEAIGAQNRIVIVGYDGTPEARDAILKGSALKADTVQHPKEIGRQAIRAIAAYLAGEKVPPVIPVEVDIIDQASLKAELSK